MGFRPFYLWIVLPVAIIIAWVVLFYWPVTKETHAKSQERVAASEAIRIADRELADISRVLDRERQIKQSLSSLYSRIPHLSELPDLMRWMIRRAKQRGLILEVVQSNVSEVDGAESSGVIHPVVEVRVKGRFLDVGRFLDDLEARTLFKGIISATVTSEERDNPIVLAKCALELNVWKEGHLEGK